MEPTHAPVADDTCLKRRVTHRWYHPQETLLKTTQIEHGSAMVEKKKGARDPHSMIKVIYSTKK